MTHIQVGVSSRDRDKPTAQKNKPGESITVPESYDQTVKNQNIIHPREIPDKRKTSAFFTSAGD